MMLRDLFHPGGHERLTEIERKPDETLHNYLMRCQSKLSDRVILLASVRDGYLQVLGRERVRWRRCKLLLSLAGPVVAGVTYTGLACSGLAVSTPALLMAVLVALGALAGAPLALGIAHLANRHPDWKKAREERRWR